MDLILRKLLYVLCLLWSLGPMLLFGQGNQFIPPPGEVQISKDVVNVKVNGKYETERYTTTGTTLFYSVYFGNGAPGSIPGSTGGWTEGTGMWKAPPPHTIINAGFSKGHDDIFLIELENGEVHRLRVQVYNVLDDSVIPAPPTIGSVGFEQLLGDALYSLTTSAIFVTRDNATWQFDTTGLNGARISRLALDTSQYVYAATDKGVYKQNPDSNVWHVLSSFTQTNTVNSVFVDRRNRVFVDGSNLGVFLSTNGGTSWTADSTGLNAQNPTIFGDDLFGNIYCTTGGKIYRSTGGTSPWVEVDQGIVGITGNVPYVSSIGGDSSIVAATTFGLFNSTDQGATWAEADSGITAERFYGFGKATNASFVVSTNLGVFVGNPSTGSWTKSYPVAGYQSGIPLQEDGQGNFYMRFSNGNGFGWILKSTDNGQTWPYDTLGISAIKEGGIFFADENGVQHIATSQYGSSFHEMIYSKNLGASWTADTVGLASSNYSYGHIMSSDQHGYLYLNGYLELSVGSAVGPLLVRRPIAGGTWTVDTTGLSGALFNQMAADRNGTMYGSNGTKLLRRTPAGWVNVPFPAQLASSFSSLLSFSFDSSNTLLASFRHFDFLAGGALGDGVYSTKDTGATWTHNAPDTVQVSSLVSYGSTTYAITDRGVFIVGQQYSSTSVRTVSSPLRTAMLLQNYPNPFNPTTVISFQLAAISRVSLKIYDLLGREVAMLVNGEMPAGMHEVPFDASRFASGIYFYRLKAGNFVATKKLILLK